MKPFVDTLNAIRYGALASELTDELQALVLACRETNKSGEITLKIKLKMGKAGQLEILDEVKVKAPAFDRSSTIMFIADGGVLTREDPRQPQLTGLREVDTSTGEIREVAVNQ